jgi:hypothetical protein
MKMNKKHLLVSVLVLLTLLLATTGCIGTKTTIPSNTSIPATLETTTDNTIKYITFEYKGNEASSLNSLFTPPPFSFEYPDFYEFRGYNVGEFMWELEPFWLKFDYFQKALPECLMHVFIENPEYPNPMKGVTEYMDIPGKKSQITISGIEANYLEDWRLIKNPVLGVSTRAVSFSYHGLNWAITLEHWENAYPDEPPFIKEYFNHVIETLKIKD